MTQYEVYESGPWTPKSSNSVLRTDQARMRFHDAINTMNWCSAMRQLLQYQQNLLEAETDVKNNNPEIIPSDVEYLRHDYDKAFFLLESMVRRTIMLENKIR